MEADNNEYPQQLNACLNFLVNSQYKLNIHSATNLFSATTLDIRNYFLNNDVITMNGILNALVTAYSHTANYTADVAHFNGINGLREYIKSILITDAYYFANSSDISDDDEQENINNDDNLLDTYDNEKENRFPKR